MRTFGRAAQRSEARLQPQQAPPRASGPGSKGQISLPKPAGSLQSIRPEPGAHEGRAGAHEGRAGAHEGRAGVRLRARIREAPTLKRLVTEVRAARLLLFRPDRRSPASNAAPERARSPRTRFRCSETGVSGAGSQLLTSTGSLRAM